MKKWIIAALLIACMMAVTACGQSHTGGSETTKSAETQANPTSGVQETEGNSYFNATGFPIVNEEITLKVLTCKNASSSIAYEDMAVWKYLSEITGIKFEFETYIDSDLYQKMPLIMADPNAMPDIFWGCGMSGTDLLTYGSQGQLLDMTDLIEQYGENILKCWDALEMNRQYATSPDGGVYGLPSYNYGGTPTGVWTFQVNTRWMENCGIKEYPTTVEEFKDMLIAFRDMDANGNGDPNDEIPMMGNETAVYQILGAAFNMPLDWPWTGAQYGAFYGTTEAVPMFMTDNYRAMIEFCSELYKEKLVNQDLFSVSGDENTARRLSDIYGVYANMTNNTAQDKWNPDEYVCIPLLSSEYQPDPTAYAYCTPEYQTGMAMISAKTKYPEACVRVLDYFFSADGIALRSASFHKEGAFDLEAAGVAQEIRDIYSKSMAANNNDTTAVKAEVIGTTGASWSGLAEYKITSSYASNIAKTYAELRETYKGKEFYNPTHTISYTEEEQEIVSVYKTDIDTYVKQTVARWYACEEELNDDTWNAYIEQLKKMGVDKLTEANVSAHNRFYGVN